MKTILFLALSACMIGCKAKPADIASYGTHKEFRNDEVIWVRPDGRYCAEMIQKSDGWSAWLYYRWQKNGYVEENGVTFFEMTKDQAIKFVEETWCKP